MPQLPGTIHDRIGDLRAQKDLTLKELAERIGVDATTLGRVERGETHRISDTLLIALATEFGVSADFLLGLTDLPDRKNYDIGELGLSTKAARVLYARQADTLSWRLEYNHIRPHMSLSNLTPNEYAMRILGNS